MESKKDHELYGTYFKITPDMFTEEIIAIQDWARSHPALTYKTFTISDVLSRSVNEDVYITIDLGGNFSSNIRPGSTFREITPEFRLRMTGYTVQPKTIQINGKHYDKSEVDSLLSNLKPKEMS